MPNGQVHLLNAHDQMAEYLKSIDEALAEDEVSKTELQIEKALSHAQHTLDELDEAMSSIENPDTVDSIEAAMNSLVVSMDLGDQVVDAPEDELEDLISDMRERALQATAYINDALAFTMM
ncbi:MAG: hypothetical protein K6U00_14645 [Armatimonadetes bacterium]|nr:hypothetical protein [Armatimonadota bacterium]